jgi:hypothetical protein
VVAIQLQLFQKILCERNKFMRVWSLGHDDTLTGLSLSSYRENKEFSVNSHSLPSIKWFISFTFFPLRVPGLSMDNLNEFLGLEVLTAVTAKKKSCVM